jgi:hypothetical protein
VPGSVSIATLPQEPDSPKTLNTFRSQPPPHSPVSEDVELYYTDLEERFSSEHCRLASGDTLLPFMPRVVVRYPADTTNMYMAPLKFYYIGPLREPEHGFQYSDLTEGVLQKTVATLEIPPSVSRITDDFTVLQRDNQIFIDCFNGLDVNFPRLIRFVI